MQLVEYFDGRRPWQQLDNYVDKIRRTRNSWLCEAEANDVERWRELEAARAADPDAQDPAPPPAKPPMHEFSLDTHLLARIAAQLEANANPGERVRPIVPASAQDVIDAETADFDEAYINEWMAEVSPEDYQRYARGEPIDIEELTEPRG